MSGHLIWPCLWDINRACQESDVDEAIGTILAAAQKHGKRAGIHCGAPAYLTSAYDRGFSFATIASDIRLIGQALSQNISAIR